MELLASHVVVAASLEPQLLEALQGVGHGALVTASTSLGAAPNFGAEVLEELADGGPESASERLADDGHESAA